jgi:osmotically-inducible protein OsmY
MTRGGVRYSAKDHGFLKAQCRRVEADSIRVVVDNDKVTLEGKVKAWYERELAERAAWSAPGVTSVVDRLTIG